jgi:hypothetical protein
MKTSYTNARAIELNIDLGIDEMETIIESLEKDVESGTNSFVVKSVLKNLKSLKAESIRQLRDSLKAYA